MKEVYIWVSSWSDFPCTGDGWFFGLGVGLFFGLLGGQVLGWRRGVGGGRWRGRGWGRCREGVFVVRGRKPGLRWERGECRPLSLSLSQYQLGPQNLSLGDHPLIKRRRQGYLAGGPSCSVSCGRAPF